MNFDNRSMALNDEARLMVRDLTIDLNTVQELKAKKEAR